MIPILAIWNIRQDALLSASGKTLIEIKEIAERSKHPYLGFLEALENLNFDDLTDRYYAFQKTENGGFENSATRYLSGLSLCL